MRRNGLISAVAGLAASWSIMGGTLAQLSAPGLARVAPDAATSDCLGLPFSPACAADTLLACLARDDARLCRSVGLDAGRGGERRPRQAVEYVIERVTPIRLEDVTADQSGLDWFKPGYIMVEVQRRECALSEASCAEAAWEAMQIVLRPRGDRFEVVTWRTETEPTQLPELPERLGPPDTAR